MSNINRFLGGSPGSVLAKLIFLSLLVGAFMAFLGITPFGLVEGLYRWIASVFDLSFETRHGNRPVGPLRRHHRDPALADRPPVRSALSAPMDTRLDTSPDRGRITGAC